MIITVAVVVLNSNNSSDSTSGSISGIVIDENGPIGGATVRIQTSNNSTVSDIDGNFTFSNIQDDSPLFITAWAQGYYINGISEDTAGASEIEIVLDKHHLTDNPDYEWLSAKNSFGEGEGQGCAECHNGENSEFSLPYEEWQADAHSKSAENPLFLTMYTGQDIHGNSSPPTTFAYSRDYGSFPLRPDLTESYYGPGYKLDFPQSNGNCGACHTPLAAIDDPYSVDPNTLEGIALEGISCDFCHKVWDVIINPETGLPFPLMPGVLSYEFLRPPEGHQFFSGPFDDVAPGEDTYTPIQQESEYCAPCHFGIFWDEVIYNSFGEWLDSPYSDPENGQTCQDCHMPQGISTHFTQPEKGGLERDPETIYSHKMLGALDEDFLKDSLEISVSTEIIDGEIVVNVDLYNNNTGHHIPTDSPLRQLLLVVTAVDENGETLNQLTGSTLPDWAGFGDHEQGYYAGLAGKGYAKILQEIWTEMSPTGAYWNPTKAISDNRIPAFGRDNTEYVFSAPDGSVSVNVKLIYRRAFIELVDWKDWDTPDILLASFDFNFD